MIAGNGDPVRGRVINIASVAGFGGHPDVWYGASKGAILNMTKSLAKLYGPQGVLINAVAPGPTKTAMFDQPPQSRIDEFNRLVFARRFAEPDEIAKVIEWLALDAPEYVNGACIDAASGGYLRQRRFRRALRMLRRGFFVIASSITSGGWAPDSASFWLKIRNGTPLMP